jgi:hypothetical protein
LDEKVVSLIAKVPVVQINDNGLSIQTTMQQIRAIPYYTWCNRGSDAMQVWIPISFNKEKINF